MTKTHHIHRFANVLRTARQLGVPPRTLRAWSEVGVGPRVTTRGLYDTGDALKWLEETRRQALRPDGPSNEPLISRSDR